MVKEKEAHLALRVKELVKQIRQLLEIKKKKEAKSKALRKELEKIKGDLD